MAVNEALARKTEIFDRSVSYIASALTAAAQATGAPPRTLYGPNNQPIPPDSYYAYRRASAKRTGTMKTWLPQRLLVKQAEALERQFIVQRSVDLANSDPNAAGIIDMHATTVIGAGLLPMPLVDQKETGLSPEEATKLAGKLRNIYRTWAHRAEA